MNTTRTFSCSLSFVALMIAGCGAPPEDEPPTVLPSSSMESDTHGDDHSVVTDKADQNGPQILFLNFNGVTLSPGDDDATRSTSGIVKTVTKFPAFNQRFSTNYYDDKKNIADIAYKVGEKFKTVNVKVVTTRPTSGVYTMIVVGGRRSLIPDEKPTAFGVALRDCGNHNPSNVGFVFTDELPSSVAAANIIIANLIAHEAGHTFGLSHVYDGRYTKNDDFLQTQTYLMYPTAASFRTPMFNNCGILAEDACPPEGDTKVADPTKECEWDLLYQNVGYVAP